MRHVCIGLQRTSQLYRPDPPQIDYVIPSPSSLCIARPAFGPKNCNALPCRWRGGALGPGDGRRFRPMDTLNGRSLIEHVTSCSLRFRSPWNNYGARPIEGGEQIWFRRSVRVLSQAHASLTDFKTQSVNIRSPGGGRLFGYAFYFIFFGFN